MTATCPVCAVEDCDRPAKGKREWCAMHVERWRRWGDPTETRPRTRAVCSVDECERLHEANGLCALHYRRLRERGEVNPAPLPRAKKSELERLLTHVDRSGGPGACWPWTGRRTERGYGSTYIERDGKRITSGAHRAVYRAVNGDLPDGLFVLHGCHNPPCCNPSHLRAGTHLENMADRQNEGAGYARGGEHPNAVSVSEETVRAIREMYRPHVKGRGQHALAGHFGLSRSEVQRIVTRSDRWAESA